MGSFFLQVVICLVVVIAIYLMIYRTIIEQIKEGKIKFDIGKIEIEDSFVSNKIESTDDYIDFSKITSRYKEGFSSDDKNGVIVLDNGTRFVAGILVKGHNLAQESYSEVASCISATNNFVEKIEFDVTFRQSTKKPDRSKQIDNYKKTIEKNKLQLAELSLDREELVSKLKIYIDSEDPEDLTILTQQIDKIEKEIRILEIKNQELELMCEYVDINSNYGALDDVQTYYFEWNKSSIENSTLKTEEDTLKYAFKELDLIGEKLIGALNATGARAIRLKADEILDSFRVVTKPYTARNIPIEKEIRSFSSLFKFTDNLSEIRKKMEEEEKINQLLKEMEIDVQEAS